MESIKFDKEFAERKAREQGREEGREDKTREIAKLLKDAGDPLEKISTITGLSISDIENL